MTTKEERQQGVPYYPCQFCNRRFLSFQDLREHYISCQKREEWIKESTLKSEENKKNYIETYLSDFGVKL